MAKAKVTHSEDAVTIQFLGSKKTPEPSTGIIKFPGGHVEVSRCSDGSYFAHIEVVDSSNILATRLDFEKAHEHNIKCVQDIPHGALVRHIAVRIENKVSHPDFG